MLESIELTEQVPLDTLSQSQYNAARAAGATETISNADLAEAEPPKVTGQEDMKEYKEKRAEQQERGPSKGGFQKRIDRLVKERSELQEKLLRYEAGQANGNGNGTPPEEQTHEPETQRYSPEQSESPTEEPKIRALRERYPDWDRVMSRAKNENIRISDDAAQVMHASEYGGHIAYMLASNDEFRKEFNKLPTAQQVKEIRKIDMEIDAIESGRKPLADKLKATFSGEEMTEILKAINTNKLGERVSENLAKELLELPNGPQVFRHLITNPDATERLAYMPTRSAAILELGRLSAKLDARYGQRLVSHAPPPIRPVSGGSTRSTVPLDEAEMADFKKRRQAGEK